MLIRSAIAVTCAVTYCVGCGPSREVDSAEVSRAGAWADSVVQELAHKHGAVTDWSSGLPGGTLERVYTVDLQKRLLDDERPVVIRAELTDLERFDNHYRAVFSPLLSRWYREPMVHFRLRVSPQMVRQLLTLSRRRYAGDVAVVAAVTKVYRPALSIAQSPSGDQMSSVLESPVAETFIAEGDALEVHTLDPMIEDEQTVPRN